MANSLVSGYHHLTLSTDGAQEDFDFYTKALGLYSIKRTVLFDGTIPVYHLYYGSRNGDPSPFAATNVCKTPLVGGQWRRSEDGTFALVVVDNQTAPNIPTGGVMEALA